MSRLSRLEKFVDDLRAVFIKHNVHLLGLSVDRNTINGLLSDPYNVSIIHLEIDGIMEPERSTKTAVVTPDYYGDLYLQMTEGMDDEDAWGK